MANKSKKQENLRVAREKAAREKAYRESCKKLTVFSYFALAVLILVVILFTVNWVEVYNTSISGAEVSVNGWNCLLATITGNYSSAGAAYGDMAVPFYYYAKSYCQTIGIFTIIAFVFVLICVGLEIALLVTKKQEVRYFALFSDILLAILLIICFAVALSMSGSKIIPVYCGGNKACSIRSYAIIPALFAFAVVILNAVASIKHILSKQKLALNG